METPRLSNIPDSLESVRIQSLPESAYYITNFLTVQEEQTILEKIYSAPKPRWKALSRRRLQTWPSDLVKNTLIATPLPLFLTDPIIPRLLSIPRHGDKGHIFEESPHSAPNHCLINEYLPGQGIFPHKDGSSYWPVVCTVSLGSSLCLDLFKSNEDGTRDDSSHQRILQEPRSLLITTDIMYNSYLHGISEVDKDENLTAETITNWSLLHDRKIFDNGINQRTCRVSLTFRDVLKVSNLGGKLGIFSKR